MRKLFVPLILASLLLIATFGMLQVARVRAQESLGQGGESVLKSEAQAENTRQITASSSVVPEDQAAPDISFIDSPTAACVQPEMAKNECFINWYYMSVDASPNYLISMTVMLNDFGYVARYNGFFQTSMYAPHSMNPEGYKVACGAPGAGGDPVWGESYAYTIRARASDGLKSANYGTVICPPYIP